MDAPEIMALAISMAGFEEKPGDSFVFNDAGPVRRALFGIDIGPEDIASAAKRGFDLVVAHHPPFPGAIASVLHRQIEIMARAGVDSARARHAYAELAAELVRPDAAESVARGTMTFSSLAASLRIGFMNVHLPCDELGRVVMQAAAGNAGPAASLGEVAAAFEAIPEIAASAERVRIARGDPSAPAGKVVVVHAAGTNGGAPVARALFDAGVGTVVYIHLHAHHESVLNSGGSGNLIITGHHGSDSIGINVLIRSMRSRGIEVETCNGVVDPAL